jgi:hypothetical protein
MRRGRRAVYGFNAFCTKLARLGEVVDAQGDESAEDIEIGGEWC